MLFYWLLFAAAALPAFSENSQSFAQPRNAQFVAGSFLVVLSLTLVIGFRYEVGGDWSTYLGYLDYVPVLTLWEVFAQPDPGYLLLNWISVEAGWGIFGVNLIGGAIFTIGLVQFCKTLPRFWLALAVAVPYLVIVVAMGYFRQGIALGFVMLGFVALRNNSLPRFLLWVVIGATFHKTAILLLMAAVLYRANNRFFQFLLVIVTAAVGYNVLLADSVDRLYETYIENEFQSQGALIRLAMNAVPGLILLANYKKFLIMSDDLSLWRWVAVAAMILFAAYFIIDSSTALDRLALYILPLQLVVFSYMPSALSPNSLRNQNIWVVMILAYFASVLAVWLLFANHAQYWLPYRFYPLDSASLTGAGF